MQHQRQPHFLLYVDDRQTAEGFRTYRIGKNDADLIKISERKERFVDITIRAGSRSRSRSTG